MRVFVIAILLVIGLCSPVEAGTVWVSGALRAMEGAELQFIDEVTGGCLPLPKVAKQAAEVELRKSRFGVREGKAATNTIYILARGQRTKEGACRAILDFHVITFVKLDPTVPWATTKLVPLVVYFDGSFHFSPKGNLQRQIEDQVAKFAREFTLEWKWLREGE